MRFEQGPAARAMPPHTWSAAALASSLGVALLIAWGCSPAATPSASDAGDATTAAADVAVPPAAPPVIEGVLPPWLGPGGMAGADSGFAPVLAGGAAAGALAVAPLGPAVAWDRGGRLLIAGGATVASDTVDPLLGAALGALSAKILVLDPLARTLGAGPVALPRARAWASAARTTGVILIAGGLVAGDASAEPSGQISWLDAVTRGLHTPSLAGAKTDLAFARGGAPAVHLIDGTDFALILGGVGVDFAAQSWELTSASDGVLAQGLLSGPRAHHGVVRVGDAGGGTILLIGGENAGGALADFEEIAFSAAGKIARADHPDPDWQPVRQTFPTGVGATLPGGAFVDRPGLRVVVIAGGFTDLGHTKPTAALLLFDVERWQWVTGTFQPSKALASGGAWTGVPSAFALQQPRGAPLVAWVPAAGGGRVLIAGGVGTSGDTLDSAEVWDPDDLAVAVSGAIASGETLTWQAQTTALATKLPDGGRAHGRMAVHPAGFVAIVGGLSHQTGSWTGRPETLLWRP